MKRAIQFICMCTLIAVTALVLAPAAGAAGDEDIYIGILGISIDLFDLSGWISIHIP